MDERILNWLSTLQALAESPSFDNGDFAALYEQAVAVAEQQSGDIVVFDESIAQVLNTRRPYGEPLPVPAYPEPVRRTFATGEPQLAGPFLGAVAKTWLLSLDVPVKRNGRTLWSLNLSFTPEQLSILDQEQVSGGRTVLVINDNGVFAGSSEPKSDLVGEPIPGWLADAVAHGTSGVVEGPLVSRGETQVVAFYRLREVPWTVAIAAPAASVAAAWHRTMWLFGALTLFVLFLAAGLAWLFSRAVTRPLLSLAAAAEDVLEGRPAALETTSIAEFESLREALLQHAAVAWQRIAFEQKAAAADAHARELEKNRKHEKMLAQEVDHRARNLLAVVQSILLQTRADDVDAYVEAVSGRIRALALSHNLIAASRWTGADLAQIVKEELAPHEGNSGSQSLRISIDGPPVALRPAAAQAFAMVLHELATNAVKYGSFHNSDGHLSVMWNTVEEELRVTWDERGGPPLTGAPERRGFGSKIVPALIERQLGGSVSMDWRREGLLVSINVPVAQLAEEGAAPAPEAPVMARADASKPADFLSGRRILVLEDEALIAAQLEALLLDRGCVVVGPVSALANALSLARSEPLDAAILDVNVGESRSDQVADVLRERKIPIVVISGYAESAHSAAFEDAIIIGKPFDEEVIARCLEQAISRNPAAPSGRPPPTS